MMDRKRWGVLLAGAGLSLATATACGSSSTPAASGSAAPVAASSAASKGSIVVASPECAHCLAMSLLPSQIPGYTTSFQSVGTLTELTAGLAAGRMQVGQIDYTGLVSFLSKGLPIVAISGEVNGGSDFVAVPKLGLAADDWKGFEALVAKDKASGHKLTIASQFGSVQDIELRLQLPKYGVSASSDVNIVNVPYQGMAAALKNGSADMAVSVQPFAQSVLAGGIAKHFAYPYDQAAGNLTNVVVVNKDLLTKNPAEVSAIAGGMSKLVPYLKTSAGQAAWAAAVEKYTQTDASTVTAALGQLTPDLKMPLSQIKAVADAMYAQKLIPQPLSEATIAASVDYAPLVAATGQTAAELGGS